MGGGVSTAGNRFNLIGFRNFLAESKAAVTPPISQTLRILSRERPVRHSGVLEPPSWSPGLPMDTPPGYCGDSRGADF